MLSELIKGLGSTLSMQFVGRSYLREPKVVEPKARSSAHTRETGPKQVARFLQQHRASAAAAQKIYEAYGEEWSRALRQEPYRLARDIPRLGFKGADKIARALGVKTNTPGRVEAGIHEALNQFTRQGHVLAPRPELARAASRLLKLPSETVEKAIRRMALFGDLVITADSVYAASFYRAEVNIAKHLHEIQTSAYSTLAEFEEADWSRALRTASRKDSAQLTPQQRKAVLLALTHKVSVLTGNVGTGKTTTVRALTQVLNNTRHTYRLVAPTRGAARRLTKAVGAPAVVLPRLLEYKPRTLVSVRNHSDLPEGEFSRNRKNPIPADFIIVADTEMIDLLWMERLLAAVHPASHVLFVGDPARILPPGPGQVLQDLIDSDALPATVLENTPQPEGKLIVTNAHRIQRGQKLLAPRTAQDFFIFKETDPERVAARVVESVKNWIPAKFGFDPLEEIQVLGAAERGATGVEALNAALQAALNPPAPHKAERRQGRRVFRVGDRVVQTRSDYVRKILEGEVGRITAMDLKRQTLTVDFATRTVDYAFAACDRLAHAFALNVRQAQGNNYRALVMPVSEQDVRLLDRRLLYTALTCARERVVLVGTRQAVATVIQDAGPSPRYSRLAEIIKAHAD